jgi:aminoglycoside phosphotransferase (APT) family kinase protein
MVPHTVAPREHCDTHLVTIVSPAAWVDDADVGAMLMRYLREHTRSGASQYVSPPARFAAGEESRVYEFQLLTADGRWSAPLVLKLFGAHVAGARAVCEAAIQDCVADAGFPAPRPLDVCQRADVLGGRPFFIMERSPGRPMLSELTAPHPRLLRVILSARTLRFRMPDVIAAWQARLHALDAAPLLERVSGNPAFPGAAGLRGRLHAMDTRYDMGAVQGFAEAMAWLRTHAPSEPERRSICHGDFWFGNVIEERAKVTGVVDWSSELCMIGDPMYDVGVTSVVLNCGMADVPGPMRAIARFGQRRMARRFVNAYRRLRAVDDERLRYYEVLRAVEFLQFVALRRSDPTLAPRERGMLDVTGATEGFVRFIAEETGITLGWPPE